MKIEGSFDGSLTPRIELSLSGQNLSVMKSEAELADGSIVVYKGHFWDWRMAVNALDELKSLYR